MKTQPVIHILKPVGRHPVTFCGRMNMRRTTEIEHCAGVTIDTAGYCYHCVRRALQLRDEI